LYGLRRVGTDCIGGGPSSTRQMILHPLKKSLGGLGSESVLFPHLGCGSGPVRVALRNFDSFLAPLVNQKMPDSTTACHGE
jgi:hypothetical protein